MPISVRAPMSREQAKQLRAGDTCLITGVIYTGRDAAHKRLYELVQKGASIPFDLKDSVIYYVGPTPAKPGQVIGSAGPTTSYRMDAYSPSMIALGQTGMIGKGIRCEAVIDAMKEHGAVYFGAIGGCGALLSSCIKSCELVAYEDLGTEAIYRLQVEDFPVIVVIDSLGNNLYESGREAYLKSIEK